VRLFRGIPGLIALLGLAVTSLPAAESLESLVAKARARIEKRDVKGARRLADKVRGIDPDGPDAFFLSGSVAELEGDVETAYRGLSRAAEKDPEGYGAELASHLAALAVQQAKRLPRNDARHALLEDAVRYLDRVTIGDPGSSGPFLEKVKVLLLLERPDDAMKECVAHRIVPVDSDPWGCVRELMIRAGTLADATPDRSRVHLAGTQPGEPSRAAMETVSLPVEWWHVDPAYPPRLREAEFEGTVVLDATIDRSGTVSDLTVLASEHPGLGFEDAAMDAVRRWRYLPATDGGEPVEVHLTISIEFELDRAGE